jgi:hypothetical protein
MIFKNKYKKAPRLKKDERPVVPPSLADKQLALSVSNFAEYSPLVTRRLLAKAYY